MRDIKIICFFFLFTIGTVSAATPRLWINPASSYGGVGSTFTSDVVISDVTDLYGCDFTLTWNPQNLECTGAVSYIPSGYLVVSDEMSKIQGYYHVAYSAAYPLSGFSGSKTLATLTFVIKSPGTSSISFSSVDLRDHYDNPIVPSISTANVYPIASTTSTTPTTAPSGGYNPVNRNRPVPLDLNAIIDFFARLFRIKR